MLITKEVQYLVLIYSGDTGNVAGIGGLFSTYEQAQTAIGELRGDYFASQFSIQPLEVDKVEVVAFYPEYEEDRCECDGCSAGVRCTAFFYTPKCGDCGAGLYDDGYCETCSIH